MQLRTRTFKASPKPRLPICGNAGDGFFRLTASVTTAKRSPAPPAGATTPWPPPGCGGPARAPPPPSGRGCRCRSPASGWCPPCSRRAGRSAEDGAGGGWRSDTSICRGSPCPSPASRRWAASWPCRSGPAPWPRGGPAGSTDPTRPCGSPAAPWPIRPARWRGPATPRR